MANDPSHCKISANTAGRGVIITWLCMLGCAYWHGCCCVRHLILGATLPAHTTGACATEHGRCRACVTEHAVVNCLRYVLHAINNPHTSLQSANTLSVLLTCAHVPPMSLPAVLCHVHPRRRCAWCPCFPAAWLPGAAWRPSGAMQLGAEGGED